MHPYLKGIGTTVFISLFFVAYFYVLRHPAYPPTVMPAIWLDRLIGFQPLALPVYLSLWLYVSLLPAFFSARAELYRYGLSMMLMCVVGLCIFYFWPTAAPAPDIDWSRYPDMDFLKNIDAAGNACPSLHVATAFFSAVWFHHLMRRFGAPRVDPHDQLALVHRDRLFHRRRAPARGGRCHSRPGAGGSGCLAVVALSRERAAFRQGQPSRALKPGRPRPRPC